MFAWKGFIKPWNKAQYSFNDSQKSLFFRVMLFNCRIFSSLFQLLLLIKTPFFILGNICDVISACLIVRWKKALSCSLPDRKVAALALMQWVPQLVINSFHTVVGKVFKKPSNYTKFGNLWLTSNFCSNYLIAMVLSRQHLSICIEISWSEVSMLTWIRTPETCNFEIFIQISHLLAKIGVTTLQG